jgi:predicted transcriptional regulator
MAFRGSPKQREIMQLVCQSERPLSVVDLHAKLSYRATASRSAIHCSIGFLVKHAMLVKQCAGRDVCLTPTPRGLALYGPRPTPDFSEDIEPLL